MSAENCLQTNLGILKGIISNPEKKTEIPSWRFRNLSPLVGYSEDTYLPNYTVERFFPLL